MIVDLTPSNRAVYAGCEVNRISEDRYHLKTPLDSAVAIVEANLKEMFSAMPAAERDELVLTGPAPLDIYLKAQSTAWPFFHSIIKVNGKTRVVLKEPTPNPDYDFSGREAE